MPRIINYPEETSPSANDVLLIDGENGSRKVKVSSILGNVIAPVEQTSTSSRNYVIGDQFIFNGLLTEATATISQGSTITVGNPGNAKLADSVAKQLTDLNNDLGEKADTEDFLVTKVFSFYSGEGIGGYASKDFTHNFTRPTGYTNASLKEIVSTDGSFIFSVRNISNTTLTVRAFNCSSTIAYPGTISYTILFAKAVKLL